MGSSGKTRRSGSFAGQLVDRVPFDILFEFDVSCMWRSVDASTCSPLPSSGYRGRPLSGSPAVRHLQRYYGLVRLLAYPSRPPPVSLGDRYSSSRVCSLPGDALVSLETWFTSGWVEPHPAQGEVGSSPGFPGTPFESMPLASDSGDSVATSRYRLPGCCLPPGKRRRLSR